MRKRRRILLCLSIFLGAAVFFAACEKIFTEKRHFKRIPFEIQPGRMFAPLEFDKSLYSWIEKGESVENILGKNITRGKGIAVHKEGSFRVRPKIQGRKGISFSLYTYSSQRNLSVSAYIKRDSRILKQFHTEEKKHRVFTQTIHEVRELDKKDEIVITAGGTGVIIVSDLLVYDIIPESKREYIFIMALDNLGCGKIGGKRNGVSLTPALNRLKADSVYFENAYAQSSWTYPSFMSLFSGLNEYNLNLRKDSFISPDKPFLVEQIADKFITVNFNGGAWLEPKYGNSRGFDRIQYVSGAEIPSSGKHLISNALDYLKKQPVPRLMMFLHTYQVHSPFSPKEEFLTRINPSPSHKNLRNYADKDQYKKDVPQEKKKALEELYDAEILEFDNYFSRFISYLKKEGIYEQSMIVFLSDHGEEFHQHKGWYHGHSLYNELVKVPLMIKFPHQKFPARVFSHNTGLLDVFPTIMDFYDIPVPKRIDGASLLPPLSSRSLPGGEVRFSTSCSIFDQLPEKAGLVSGHYKIIFNFPYTEEEWDYFPYPHKPPSFTPVEIYDLEADPDELNNLARVHPELIDKFRDQINQMVEQIQRNRSKKTKGKVILNEKDREKLRSLGYLR